MEEIDLKEVIQIFWENKVRILIITLLFVVIGIVYTAFGVSPVYESSTTLLLATNSSKKDSVGTVIDDGITTTDVTLNSNLVATYSELVKSNKTLRTVISNLNLSENEEEIRKNVSVNAKSDTEVIEITVKNANPSTASQIANEIAKVFIGIIKEYYGIENVHVVDEAEVPTEPCNINHKKDVVIFAFIGFVVSAGYVFIITLLDTRIKSVEDIEEKLGLLVLATIPLCDKASISKEGGTKNAKK